MKGMLDLLRDRPAEAPFMFVSTPNAQHVVRIQRGDARAIAAHDQAWITPCDSRVLIRLASALFGLRLPLVAGSDLTQRLFDDVIDPNEPITVIGGTAELARLLRTQLGLTRLALFDPPYGFYNDPAEMDRAAAFVEEYPARFVFLACGTPQSELLGIHIARRGRATGCGLAIGASLLFLTGQLRRAPRLFQVAGLEWLYRLGQEPRRLWRRLVADQLPVLLIALRFRFSRRLSADQSQRGQWR
jgi:exopolysaccharide biosynthesis WecB/TagA/CpsF family protein